MTVKLTIPYDVHAVHGTLREVSAFGIQLECVQLIAGVDGLGDVQTVRLFYPWHVVLSIELDLS